MNDQINSNGDTRRSRGRPRISNPLSAKERVRNYRARQKMLKQSKNNQMTSNPLTPIENPTVSDDLDMCAAILTEFIKCRGRRSQIEEYEFERCRSSFIEICNRHVSLKIIPKLISI